MSITAKKITSTTVLKGVSPSSKALPVMSSDTNPIIDDLTSIDSRVSTLELNVAKSTVTQITAITTGVTINAAAGVITTVSSTLAAGSNATFIVTNSFVTSASVIMLTVDDSASAGLAKLNVQTVGSGVFSVNITNIHATNAFNNVIKIHFLIV